MCVRSSDGGRRLARHCGRFGWHAALPAGPELCSLTIRQLRLLRAPETQWAAAPLPSICLEEQCSTQVCLPGPCTLQDARCLEPMMLSQEDLMQLTDPIFSSLLLCSLPTHEEEGEDGGSGIDGNLGAGGLNATKEAEEQEARARMLLATHGSSTLASPFSHLSAAQLDPHHQQQQLSITAQHTASLHTPSITSVGSGCATSATTTPPPPFVPSPAGPTQLGLSPWEQQQQHATVAAHQQHQQELLLQQAFQMAAADGMDQCLPWGPQDGMQGAAGAGEMMPAMGEGWQAVGNRLPVLQPRAPAVQHHAQQPQHSPMAAQQLGMPACVAQQQQQQQQFGEQQVRWADLGKQHGRQGRVTALHAYPVAAAPFHASLALLHPAPCPAFPAPSPSFLLHQAQPAQASQS